MSQKIRRPLLLALAVGLPPAIFMGSCLAMRSAAESPPPVPATLAAALEALRPLHEPLAPPRQDEWLDKHDEPGQTFAQYRSSRPKLPRGERRILYILPIGEFAPLGVDTPPLVLKADFIFSGSPIPEPGAALLFAVGIVTLTAGRSAARARQASAAKRTKT